MNSVITRRELFGVCAGAAESMSRGTRTRFDDEALDQLFAGLRQDERRDLKGVRVVSEGSLVKEEYFNGDGPDSLHDIRSAGKSITSLLTGIAIDRKLIANVLVPFIQLLGSNRRPELAPISLEHLLTMRSGLAADDEDPTSPGNENRMDQASSWIDFALSVPVREAPGRSYQYCSLNAFLVGACVENACHRPLDEFAREHLFKPLGIDRFEWRRGPQNRVAGQGNLRITLSSMSTIGQMCLEKGRVGSSQVVSAKWLERSMASIVPISDADPYADAYGYMWYTKAHQATGKSVRVCFASGNGGNKIYVIPELRTTVAIMSAAYGRGYGQRRSQEILRGVLNAVRV